MEKIEINEITLEKFVLFKKSIKQHGFKINTVIGDEFKSEIVDYPKNAKSMKQSEIFLKVSFRIKPMHSELVTKILSDINKI